MINWNFEVLDILLEISMEVKTWKAMKFVKFHLHYSVMVQELAL